MFPRFHFPSLREFRGARSAWLGGLLLLVSAWPTFGAIFRTNDVVVFLGGAAVVSADREGAVETVLTVAHPGFHLRFRTLAWEGDTVRRRPRELNFPSLPDSLKRCQATVVCTQFGALEALDPTVSVAGFREGYTQLLDTLAATGTRAVLIVPPAFESHPPPLPDLAPANERLAQLADAMRALAAERRLPVIDLQNAFAPPGPPGPRTYDGREPTPLGHRLLAATWARQLDAPRLAEQAASPAFWAEVDVAQLQRAVNTKNRLWFDSWRPMNWAFLAGDRTEQQASRDHRDPKIRWFPAEMEEYGPLIVEADNRIESLAAQVRLAP